MEDSTEFYDIFPGGYDRRIAFQSFDSTFKVSQNRNRNRSSSKTKQDLFKSLEEKPHGLGRLIYRSIQGAYILEGYFFDGQATGYARWIFEDGLCYEGQLLNFKCHGRGKKYCGN